MKSSHRIVVADKVIRVQDQGIEDLFKDLIRTTTIPIEIQAELVDKVIATLAQHEQVDLLEEIEQEKIFPLGYLVTA
jgi:hypothetical protein